MIRSSFLVLLLVAACSDETELRRPICSPGEMRCSADGSATICSPSGLAWMPSDCPVGTWCVTSDCDGELEPRCRPIVCGEKCDPATNSLCTPRDKRCNPDDNVRIEACNETGTDWCCEGSCAAPQIDGVCYDARCVAVCAVGEKSYLGCDYFAVDLDNAYVPCGTDDAGNLIYCDAAGSQFAVVISNPDTQREVVYQISNAPVASEDFDECDPPEHIVAAGVLPPKGIEILELPRRDVNGTIKAMRAYRLASNAPITAYQFNPLENVDVFSNDASLLLPTNAVGDSYYVMTREQTFDDLKGFITVVGVTEETATVTVTVTAQTLAGPQIPALAPGESFTTTLDRYEVLNIETNDIGADLTGSTVTSTESVVVFGGSEAANTPNTSRCDLSTNTCEWIGDDPDPCVVNENCDEGWVCLDDICRKDCECTQADGPTCSPHAKCSEFITCCADHLEQQMFPLAAWGTEYLAIRSMPRGTVEFPGQEMDSWRILAAEDDTEVTLTPAFETLPLLAAGEWYELETNEDFLINSNKPVLVGQFLAAEFAPNPGRQEGDAATGDPAFILIAPARQLRDNYVFLAPNKYEFDYVSIGAPAGTVVRLDGVDIESLEPAARQLTVRDIPGTTWRAFRANITDGFHVLTCPATCSIMVHGYDSFVSYGYPGGLNLEDEEP